MKYLLIFQFGGAIGLSTFAGLVLHGLNQKKKVRRTMASCSHKQAKTPSSYEPVAPIYIPDGDPLDYGISRGLKVKETIRIKPVSYEPCEW